MHASRAALPALLCTLAACAPATRSLGVAPTAAPITRIAAANEDGGRDPDWVGALPGDEFLAEAEAAVVVPTDLAVAAWDISVLPYLTDERVGYYVDLFGGEARGRFAERLQRGTRYEAMIRGKLRTAGMPEDLFYLALVESGFEPDAYSKAAAVGMWQFMTTTARGVGLRVDWWIDERRDPIRSTDAAIRYLRELRDEFDGSMYLAAAAYNGGSGRVSRGLTQFAASVEAVEGDDRFFALAETGYLRAETRNYVPQLIAAATVAKSPGIYGISFDSLAPFAFDTVRVPAGTPLAAIAAAAGASASAIADLNPQFLRGTTPPGSEETVRVPSGAADGYADRFTALPAARRTAFTRVTTRDNGKLSAIARQHGMSEAQLATFNPGVRRNKRGLLVGGQTICIPSHAVLAAARDVADPSIERYGSSAPARSTTASRKASGSISHTHKVARGEVLGTIAQRYGLSVARLRSLNGLRSDIIRPGQVLQVGSGSSSKASAKRATTSSKTSSTTIAKKKASSR